MVRFQTKNVIDVPGIIQQCIFVKEICPIQSLSNLFYLLMLELIIEYFIILRLFPITNQKIDICIQSQHLPIYLYIHFQHIVQLIVVKIVLHRLSRSLIFIIIILSNFIKKILRNVFFLGIKITCRLQNCMFQTTKGSK